MVLRLLKTVLSALGATFLITMAFAFLFSAYIRAKGPEGSRQIGFSASLIAPYLIGISVLLSIGFFLLFKRG